MDTLARAAQAGVSAKAALANNDGYDRLIRIPEPPTLALAIPRIDAPGCVLVGMNSRALDGLRAEIGLPRALRAVATLPRFSRKSKTRCRTPSCLPRQEIRSQPWPEPEAQ